MRRSLETALGIALLSLAGCGGGGGSGGPPEVWVATALGGGCETGAGNLPGSSCRRVRIDGPGVPPLVVELRAIEPAAGVPLTGTVIVGTGAFGTDFTGEQQGGEELFRSLTALGFRIVDRRWVSSWSGSGTTFRVQSRRYATLLQWVHQNLHTEGTFSAVGNSSGASEIAYALTTWGRAGLLDAVVLCAGPPHTRLDLVCRYPPSPSWQVRCEQIVPAGVLSCGGVITCSMTSTSEGIEVCQKPWPNRTLQQLRDDSVLHRSALTDFGSTRVHVVLGTEDCTNAAISGLLFFEEVTGQKAIEFAPATNHIVWDSEEGRDAIVRALLGTVPAWSGPVTLSARAWPRVGGALELELRGQPGDAFEVFLSAETGSPRASPTGWWLLGTRFVALGGGTLRAADGRATFSVPLPDDPALAGLPLYQQATAGALLTNALGVVVRR